MANITPWKIDSYMTLHYTSEWQRLAFEGFSWTGENDGGPHPQHNGGGDEVRQYLIKWGLEILKCGLLKIAIL